MSQVRWTSGERIRVFDAQRPLRAIVAEAQADRIRWIVLDRVEGGARYRYAFRYDELVAYAVNRPDRLDDPAANALQLHEFGASEASSPVDAIGNVPAPAPWQPPQQPVYLPSMLRTLQLDARGQPSAVGEVIGWAGPRDAFMHNFELSVGDLRSRGIDLAPNAADTGLISFEDHLGNLLGGQRAVPPEPEATARAEPPAEPQTVPATLSAEGPSSMKVGEEAIVDVRLELAAGAEPLAHRVDAPINPTEKIVAILSVDTRLLRVLGQRWVELDPPSPDQPTMYPFQVQGLHAGAAAVSVMFRQGGSDLGTVAFKIAVVAAQDSAGVAPPDGQSVGASVVAMRREPTDDDVLVLLIEQEQSGNQVYFKYLALWKPLGWNYREFKSDLLKAPARGAGAATIRYVRTIYQRILDRVLTNTADVALFQEELKAIGTDMCRQLVDPEFRRLIWDHRDQIQIVQVTTQEPYIPWELLRLEHPDDRQKVDDKFLCEYGLIRSLNGRSGPRDLRAHDWRYLVGSYPLGSQAPLGLDVDYLTGKLPTRGITPRVIPPDALALVNALKAPDFDVLHLACHGATDLKNVEQSALIIADRQTPQGVKPVTITPTTVQGAAQLAPREPIVFLNACESGQQAPSLTDWGGWPRAFWDAGAGAFVGTSWSVYERPASMFAAAFYDAFLGGATLAEAATAGRTAAKAVGDGSWLAYVLYGNPMARLAPNTAPPPAGGAG